MSEYRIPISSLNEYMNCLKKLDAMGFRWTRGEKATDYLQPWEHNPEKDINLIVRTKNKSILRGTEKQTNESVPYAIKVHLNEMDYLNID